ncbi:MAG: DUF4412 domain-containing protein [Flavobacteriales bacterium]|nr:DUF4412 domain-containing protein [Flavobacteriales bacterium]
MNSNTMERIGLFALAAIFATTGFAQNDKVDEVGDKAMDKGEQRVDRKIDQGLDAGFDKIEGVLFGKKKSKDKGDSKSSDKSTDQGHDEAGQEMEAAPVPYTGGVSIEENNDPFEPLDFTGSYRMVIHSHKNGSEVKDSPAEMLMAFNIDHMAMVPKNPDEKGDMRMVFDLRNKHTYTLITDDKGKKSGIKMKMMKVNVEGDGKENGKVADVVRTDETRTIEGRTCRKYTYKDEKGSGEAWFAEDISFDMMAAFKQMVGGKGVEDWQNLPHTGVVMENTWNSADGKEKVTMFTKDLVVGQVDESLFSTAGFEVMDMSSMPMYGK